MLGQTLGVPMPEVRPHQLQKCVSSHVLGYPTGLLHNVPSMLSNILCDSCLDCSECKFRM
jgi:hypothetical protein